MTAPPAGQPAGDVPGQPAELPPEGRITLMLTSPRVAAGLLSAPAWLRLQSADAVLAGGLDPVWAETFEQLGVTVDDVAALPVAHRAGRLVAETQDLDGSPRELVWWGGPDGDPGLTDALAEHLSRRAVAGHPPEVEVITASHDVQGARLLDLVQVMDVLRSPGGCPWDAEQTHTSLLPYLLEETHEVIEAVEARDRAHLEEELGDLLLQVVFHARVAEEAELDPFDIDDVAAGIVAKLVRRHPHVFAPDPSADPSADTSAGTGADLARADDPAQVEANWEELKSREKPDRQAFEGIPVSLPSLARAQKMLGRLERSGTDLAAATRTAAAGDELVQTLLAAVLVARREGRDAEADLRAALARLPGRSVEG